MPPVKSKTRKPQDKALAAAPGAAPGDKPVRNGDKPRKSVPQRDGLGKRLADRIARGGAL